ncbi:MAG TPA: hypothetical protein VFQ61_21225 [Polyangiaceae bacterium]|nr:hypothetical protein [Polyangiaceae bacterium]
MAALSSWIWCTHGSTPSNVRASYRGIALKTTLAAPIAYVFACATILAIGSIICRVLYGLPIRAFASSASETVNGADARFGVLSMLAQILILVAAARFAAPKLAGVSWGLLRKLIVGWVSLAVLRTVVAHISDGVWNGLR